MLISNKRKALVRGLDALGLTRMLAIAAKRPGLLVLGYHRIGSPDGETFEGVVSADTATFERQIRNLKDHFQLLTLEDVLTLAESGFDLTEPSAMISFDDGYLDNFTEAMPILQSVGAPATFFLPSGFLEHPRPFWWDHVAIVLHQSRCDQLSLDWPVPTTFNFAGSGRAAAQGMIISWFLEGRIADEAAFLEHLEMQSLVFLDGPSLGRELLMNRAQARAMGDAGLGIGSHGRTHRSLSRLLELEQQEELSRSKRDIKTITGHSVEAIAYPFGVAGAFDEALMRRSQAVGYRLGFTFEGGINRPGTTDAMAVRRINVGFSDSAEMLRARSLCYSAMGRSWL